MITQESIEQLARQYHTRAYPNIIREYVQHLFLKSLYKESAAAQLLFKGGTALRVVYGSPRFSEDLDFSLCGGVKQHNIKQIVESLFLTVLSDIEHNGIDVDIGEKSGETSGGYFGIATCHFSEFKPVEIEINASLRDGRGIRGEVDSIANDFVPTYNLVHLPQQELVEEKVFGALLHRNKSRDFYDLYWLMRKGMLSVEQKVRLAQYKEKILDRARTIDFRDELEIFLPSDQQNIIHHFFQTLEGEMDRQFASVS